MSQSAESTPSTPLGGRLFRAWGLVVGSSTFDGFDVLGSGRGLGTACCYARHIALSNKVMALVEPNRNASDKYFVPYEVPRQPVFL